MKTIAIIASCDTKEKEAVFMSDCVKKAGCKPLVLDMSIGLGEPAKVYDISRVEILKNAGYIWDDIYKKTKGELVVIIIDAMQKTVKKLYDEGAIDGVVSAGGVQNTTVATRAMQMLPVGFPKAVATTVASGKKEFENVVFDKDIVVMPSISDFTGINLITERILENVCACVCGMANYAGSVVSKSDKVTVGVTLMGVTTKGACAAIDTLVDRGIETIGFHSTGVGGMTMERFANEGLLDGILDFTTHEITSEFFKGGFSYGEGSRLELSVAKEVPMVVCPGGLDFVDYPAKEFPLGLENRIYNMHNDRLAHIKILEDEAKKIGEIFASRLNKSKQKIHLLLPTNGMRVNTKPDGNLYAPNVDKALLDTIRATIDSSIVEVVDIEGNMNEKDWGTAAANVMINLLCERKLLS